MERRQKTVKAVKIAKSMEDKMAIAKADWKLMKQVADYFESTEKIDANDKSRKYILKNHNTLNISTELSPTAVAVL